MPPELFSHAPVNCLNLRDIVLGRFLGILAVVIVTSLLPAQALQSVTVAWNASSGAAGYKVYFGTVAGNPGVPIDVGNVSTATISNLNDATTYYFSASAYNSAGLESQRSGEIVHTTASQPTNTYTLTVNSGSGDGPYPAGAQVVVTANSPPAGQQFTRWDGDYVILANRFSSTTSATIPAQDVAITAIYSISAGNGTGLRAQFYNDGSNASYPLTNPFAGSPVLTRTDATVDFDWGASSPGSGVPSNFFSVKWTGQVKAPVSGTYTFTVTGDDGVCLFINGNRVINAWRDQGATNYTYTTTLAAGTLYDIELHYYEHEGDAVCRLRWSYPGQWIQVIPQSQLYPN